MNHRWNLPCGLLLCVALLVSPTDSFSASLRLTGTGNAWEDGGLEESVVGDELSLLGRVSEISAPFIWDTDKNAVTWSAKQLVSTGDMDLGGGRRLIEYTGGVIRVNVDFLPDNSDFGVNPPNATAPASFEDGISTYMEGTFTSFSLSLNDASGSGTFEGVVEWSAGDVSPFLCSATGRIRGTIASGGAPTGYDLVVNECVLALQILTTRTPCLTINEVAFPGDLGFGEVHGEPSTDYSTYTLVVLEGKRSSRETPGTILAAWQLGTTDENGFWATEIDEGIGRKGAVSVLLVEGYRGRLGKDLDADDNGTIDVEVFDAVLDDVSFGTARGDVPYSKVDLGADAPGGSRIDDGFDSDHASDWAVNDPWGAGLPGNHSVPELNVAWNTPGAPNSIFTQSGATSTPGLAPFASEVRIAAVSPNPVSSSTAVTFSLPATAEVVVDVFDVRGVRVSRLVEGSLPAGQHVAQWIAEKSAATSGVYFVRVTALGAADTRRVVLLR